jgi:hypothetical protein
VVFGQIHFSGNRVNQDLTRPVDATGHVTLVELSIGRRVQSTHLARLHFLDLKDSRVEKEKANYLLRYYGPLMTMHERQAYSDLLGAAKMSNGITDAAALEAFRNSTRRWRSVSADNPQVYRGGRNRGQSGRGGSSPQPVTSWILSSRRKRP